MERYLLAVLVVAFLALSSADGAAFIGPGEALQCMLGAMYLWAVASFLMFVRSPHCVSQTFIIRNPRS